MYTKVTNKIANELFPKITHQRINNHELEVVVVSIINIVTRINPFTRSFILRLLSSSPEAETCTSPRSPGDTPEDEPQSKNAGSVPSSR